MLKCDDLQRTFCSPTFGLQHTFKVTCCARAHGSQCTGSHLTLTHQRMYEQGDIMRQADDAWFVCAPHNNNNNNNSAKSPLAPKPKGLTCPLLDLFFVSDSRLAALHHYSFSCPPPFSFSFFPCKTDVFVVSLEFLEGDKNKPVSDGVSVLSNAKFRGNISLASFPPTWS